MLTSCKWIWFPFGCSQFCVDTISGLWKIKPRVMMMQLVIVSCWRSEACGQVLGTDRDGLRIPNQWILVCYSLFFVCVYCYCHNSQILPVLVHRTTASSGRSNSIQGYSAEQPLFFIKKLCIYVLGKTMVLFSSWNILRNVTVAFFVVIW
jgi:hypothetical protein